VVGGTALGLHPFCSWSIVGVMVIAALQHRLSGLGHEACHYALFKNRLANELVSDLLCMFPLMAMTQRFRVTHLGHHQFLNDPNRDPMSQRLHFDGDRYPFPMSKATFWYRYGGDVALAAGAAQVSLRPGQERQRDGRLPRAQVRLPLSRWPVPARRFLAANAERSCTSPVRGRLFLLFWVTPLLTFYHPFFMQLREICAPQQHAGGRRIHSFTELSLPPDLQLGGLPLRQDYHLTHHVFGLIPHFNLTRAHEILLRYPPLSRGSRLRATAIFSPAGKARDPRCWMLLSQGVFPRVKVFNGSRLLRVSTAWGFCARFERRLS